MKGSVKATEGRKKVENKKVTNNTGNVQKTVVNMLALNQTLTNNYFKHLLFKYINQKTEFVRVNQ